MRVVFDSNIICRDYQLAGTHFRTLLETLERTGHSLYVPQLVLEEVTNKYQQEVESSLHEIDRQFDNVRRVTGERFEASLSRDDLPQLGQSYREYFLNTLDSAGAGYLDYPSKRHQEIALRGLQHRKPFKENGSGYRDTLIWESVLELCLVGEETVAFISQNTKDFADNGTLHPDLRAEVDALGSDHAQVTYFSSLQEFNNKHVIPLLEQLTNIRDQLQAGEYEGLDLREFLTKRFIHDVPPQIFAPSQLGLPDYFENPTLDYLEQVQAIRNVDVRRISPDELRIEFSAVVTAGFDFRVRKTETGHLTDEQMASIIYDDDWSETHIAGVIARKVIIQFSSVFDTQHTLVRSTEITRIRPYEDLASVLMASRFGQQLAEQLQRTVQLSSPQYDEMVRTAVSVGAQIATFDEDLKSIIQAQQKELAIQFDEIAGNAVFETGELIVFNQNLRDTVQAYQKEMEDFSASIARMKQGWTEIDRIASIAREQSQALQMLEIGSASYEEE